MTLATKLSDFFNYLMYGFVKSNIKLIIIIIMQQYYYLNKLNNASVTLKLYLTRLVVHLKVAVLVHAHEYLKNTLLLA